MSQKDPQIDVQESHSSSGSPSKHECVDDSQGGRQTRLQPSHESLYPSALRVGMTIFALLIAVLCVALDSTIVSTAIPRITDEFHDLHDVGWYGSGQLHHPRYQTMRRNAKLIASQLIFSRSVRSNFSSARSTEPAALSTLFLPHCYSLRLVQLSAPLRQRRRH